jgi:hypothetical protein
VIPILDDRPRSTRILGQNSDKDSDKAFRSDPVEGFLSPWDRQVQEHPGFFAAYLGPAWVFPEDPVEA